MTVVVCATSRSFPVEHQLRPGSNQPCDHCGTPVWLEPTSVRQRLIGATVLCVDCWVDQLPAGEQLHLLQTLEKANL